MSLVNPYFHIIYMYMHVYNGNYINLVNKIYVVGRMCESIVIRNYLQLFMSS